MRSITRKVLLMIGALILLTPLFLKAQDTLRILPMGNSITHGYMYASQPLSERYGYRLTLYNNLLAADYPFDFIGHAASGYDYLPTEFSHHLGIPGIRDEHLRDILTTGSCTVNSTYYNLTSGPYLNTYSPDVILLHIGSNDVNVGDVYNLSEVEEILDAIDDYETSSGKPVLVFLAKIISTKTTGSGSCTDNVNVTRYNSKLADIYNSRVAQGDHLVWVDMQCGASIHYNWDMYDTHHPNNAGYTKIGQKWFDAIHSFNSAPVISNIPNQSILEGQSFAQINLNNYIQDVETSDANISWSTVPAIPEHLNISIVGNVATITPKDENWNGTENIQFVASDNGKIVQGLRKIVSDDASFTITPLNDPPVILSQVEQYTILEDNSVEILKSHFTISDVDNLSSDISLEILPGSNYSVVDATHIQPSEDQTGMISINVRANDLSSNGEVFEASVNILPVNDAPEVAGQIALIINEDEQITIQKNYLTIDDPDNAIEEIDMFISNGDNYELSGQTVIPDKDFFGTLYVPVRLRDLQEFGGYYQLEITVSPVNDAPILIFPINEFANEDEAYSKKIYAVDVDGDVVTPVLIAGPSWGSYNAADSLLSGIPLDTDIGQSSFTFQVNDGQITVDSTFTITVLNTNDPPELYSSPILSADDYETYSYTLEFSDPDDDEISVRIPTLPRWLSYNGKTYTIEGMPRFDDIGDWEVSIELTDGEFTLTQEFTITVEDINSPPTITSEPLDTARVDSKYIYPIEAVDVDENDELEYIGLKIPSFLTFVPESGILLGTPAYEDRGYREVIVAVTDHIDTTKQIIPLYVESYQSIGHTSQDLCSIYPNVIEDHFFIEFGQNQLSSEAIINILNLKGQVVHSEKLKHTNSKHMVELESFSSGQYLIQVILQEYQVSKPVIIK